MEEALECCCLQGSPAVAVLLNLQIPSCSDPWESCHYWALPTFLPCSLQDKVTLSVV